MPRRKTSRTGQTVKNPIGTATRKSPKTGEFDVATDLIPAESFKNIEEMERTPRARMRRTERSVSPPGDTMREMEEDEKLLRASGAFYAPGRMREGGMIPPEKKGFNMLPESVQNKIDSDLAAEFMHGGEVEAPSQNVSRGTRAAIKGKKFSGVY